jgi:murein DD-endopeptidase MepM/ murein hydrolase activator NlpD
LEGLGPVHLMQHKKAKQVVTTVQTEIGPVQSPPVAALPQEVTRQGYFVLTLAHSLHGKLRQMHVPYRAIYGVGVLAIIGLFSVAGIASSYARMAWKVANYNALQEQMGHLQNQYEALEKEATETSEHLASLQVLASEVTMAFGVKQKLEGPVDIAAEGALLPDFAETLEQYDFLKGAKLARRSIRPLSATARPSLWPVVGRLGSSFGSRIDPFSGMGAFHAGIDLTVNEGTAVKATGDGVVVHAEWSGSYGRLVVIDHGNGLQTYYGHLSGFTVVPGQEIRRGQIVALSGSTGKSTAPHLHYEVRMGGTPVNPYRFLSRTVSTEVVRDLPL